MVGSKQKEIHAYANGDGTYRVQLVCDVKQSRFKGRARVEESAHSECIIPRATIHLTAFRVSNSNREPLTIEVEE